MLHPHKDKPTVATEIALVAGITCDLDSALTSAMSYHCGEQCYSVCLCNSLYFISIYSILQLLYTNPPE